MAKTKGSPGPSCNEGPRSLDELPKPDEHLLETVIIDLGLAHRSDVSTIKRLLSAHASAFAMGLFLQSRYPTVHEDAKRMATIRDAADRILELLESANPLNATVIAAAMADRADEPGKLDQARKNIELLRDVSARFAGIPFARKQRNQMLEHAVGGLMLLFEKLTGNRATVQERQSDRGIPPRLSSPEAAAIGMLLRVAQPRLQTTTLVNTINRIRREAGNGPLDRFEHQLLLGGTVTVF